MWLILAVLCSGQGVVFGQSKKASKPAYRNLFREAGYKQADIDAKLAKAYHDVFEGPNKVYFEVGDTMAYVSDVKNERQVPDDYATDEVKQPMASLTGYLR